MVIDHSNFVVVESVAISDFKARCLALLEKVRRTGRGLIITRHGEPVAEVLPPSPTRRDEAWLGSAAGTGKILGDLIAPAASQGDWDALNK